MKKLLLLGMLLVMLCLTATSYAQVTLGVERLGEPQVQRMLAHKRVGLFTNQSGVDRRLTSSMELVRAQADLQAIFVQKISREMQMAKKDNAKTASPGGEAEMR